MRLEQLRFRNQNSVQITVTTKTGILQFGYQNVSHRELLTFFPKTLFPNRSFESHTPEPDPVSAKFAAGMSKHDFLEISLAEVRRIAD